MAKKSSTKKSATRRWVRKVKTDSTHPPPRTFTGSASEIARKMARKDVSPKGDWWRPWSVCNPSPRTRESQTHPAAATHERP